MLVLPKSYPVPDNAQKIGSIKAGNNATAVHCDYEAVVAEIKEKARAMGGNLVKITGFVAPVFISKCYKIEADVYHTDHLPVYNLKQQGETVDTMLQDKAVIYIYRLKDTIAFAPAYEVHLNDNSSVYHARSNSRYVTSVDKEGEIILWTKMGKRTELKIIVRKGEQYYIRCGLIAGDLRKQPVLEVMDKKTGAAEYGKQYKNKDIDVKYLYQIH